MTSEEAICELSVIRERLSHPKDCENGCYSFRDGNYTEALDMAIEALSTPSDDLISRADAIDAVWKLDKEATEYVMDDTHEIHGYCTAIGVCVGELSALPSADADVVRKPIKGYDDYYEVDQFGRVFAKERIIHVTDHDREYDKHLPSRQMKQSVHTKGYKTVPLTKDGVCTTKFVHRLVAEAFIPNPDDLPFVNHIDEDKTNNFVENLEWCTEQYNSTYGKAREKHAKALKGRHHTEEHKKKISDSLKRFHGERKEP